jgi:hypothetical protein
LISADDIIGALKNGYAGGTLNDVLGAGAMPEAYDQVRVTKTAFVMPPGERAISNDAGTGVIRQKSTVEFLILVVFKNIGPTGADQTREIDLTREGVKGALLGLLIADMTDPIQLVSAGVIDVSTAKGALLYGLAFSTGYHIRRP